MKYLPKIKIHDYRGEDVKWAQHKADGHYVEVYRESEGIFAFKKKREVNYAPKLMHLGFDRIPLGFAVRGELHADDVQATSIPTLINEASPKLQFTPFAVDRLGDVPLQEVNSWLRAHGFEPPTTFSVSPPLDVQRCLRDIQAEGIEGYILKDGHLGPWYKLKPVKTVDCIVLDAPMSYSTSFFGGLKCLIVGAYVGGELKQIARVGTGFDAEYRMSLDTDEKREALVGRVCEVEYQDMGAKGHLKFPRFLRWREDKPKEECIL